MLKLKIVKAFFYAEAMVTSPSCNLFSWNDRSIHCMVSTNWKSGVQSWILWLEFVSNSPIYIPKLPRNHAHSLTHRLAKLLHNCRRFVPSWRRFTVCWHWNFLPTMIFCIMYFPLFKGKLHWLQLNLTYNEWSEISANQIYNLMSDLSWKNLEGESVIWLAKFRPYIVCNIYIWCTII
jgi:hypothetical protein